MNSLTKPSELFSNSASEFQKAYMLSNKARNNFKIICELYKSILDSNFSGRFCIDGDCITIFMVEITLDGHKWGATPKVFYSKEQAEKEAEMLKLIYPFVSECRVITRKIEGEKRKD